MQAFKLMAWKPTQLAQFKWLENSWLRKYSKKCKSSPSSRAFADVHKYRFRQPYTLNFAPGRELWNADRIKKNLEVVPLLLIIGTGLVALISVVIHNTYTRDDVRYFKSKKFGYYKTSHLHKKRKLLIFNQTYKEVEGLRDVYKEMEAKEKN